MLATDERELILDSLRPPEGYEFDRGIGTTFTLDLLTLLIAPLSLALLDVPATEKALADPLLLLEALRRYADRLAIFCQAGRIAVPQRDHLLFRLLEGMVVQVQAGGRGAGVFHPKLWLLRYIANGRAPLYRLLNLSRNLTFDRSWDLGLRLEGELADRQHAYSRNHPVGDFLQALPALALHPLSERIAKDLALMQDEVRRVAFQPPQPFEPELAFHPLGIRGYGSFRFGQRYSRVMVMSPFLTDGQLQRVAASGQGNVLISRMDSIAALSAETRARFEKIYVLDDAGLETEEAPMATAEVGVEASGVSRAPAGLHAKLFVMEERGRATWLVGSANATDAAFRRSNVEFMVSLHGRRHQVGIDQILGMEENGHGLRAILRPFPALEEVIAVDPEQHRAETLADQVRCWLIALCLRLEVLQRDRDCFDVQLTSDNPQAPSPLGDYDIACWPVSLGAEQRSVFCPTSPLVPKVFTDLSLLALTPFIAFEVVAHVKDCKHRLRFVLNLPICGILDDRMDRLTVAVISDRARFLRYLWLLLSQGEHEVPAWVSLLSTEGARGWRLAAGSEDLPLLEMLVRTLSRSPDRIGQIDELAERLKRTPEGREILPAGFEVLWSAVLQARRTM